MKPAEFSEKSETKFYWKGRKSEFMKFKKNSAVILVDFLEEFINGNKNEVLLPKSRSKKLIKNTVKLVEKAQKKKVPVIHVHCLHRENDSIFRITGKHAIKGKKKTWKSQKSKENKKGQKNKKNKKSQKSQKNKKNKENKKGQKNK